MCEVASGGTGVASPRVRRRSPCRCTRSFGGRRHATRLRPERAFGRRRRFGKSLGSRPRSTRIRSQRSTRGARHGREQRDVRPRPSRVQSRRRRSSTCRVRRRRRGQRARTARDLGHPGSEVRRSIETRVSSLRRRASLCSVQSRRRRRSARRSARSRPPPRSRGRGRALAVESHRASHVSSRTPSGSDSGRRSLASLVRAPCSSRWLARPHRIGRSSAVPPRSRSDPCHSRWVLDSDAQPSDSRAACDGRLTVNLSLLLAVWANDESRTTVPQPPMPARKVRLMGRPVPTEPVALDEAARSQTLVRGTAAAGADELTCSPRPRLGRTALLMPCRQVLTYLPEGRIAPLLTEDAIKVARSARSQASEKPQALRCSYPCNLLEIMVPEACQP